MDKELKIQSCCSHCSQTNKQLAEWSGKTEKEIQKERDNCNGCCKIFRNIKNVEVNKNIKVGTTKEKY